MTGAERIQVRNPEFAFDASIPRHWLAENAVATHLFNGLNLVFPDGERFFIQAVLDCASDVPGAELRREVRLFSGQEGAHAREHERYFETLEAQGYQIQGFLKRFGRFMACSNRCLPAPLRLAMTAGAEHYTATFGAFSFDDALLSRAHPTMRKLLFWHAAEEIEHKHVAFDVLRATHPSLWLRRLGFLLATVELFGFSSLATRMLLRQDLRAGRIDRASVRVEREALRERESRIRQLVRKRARAYWRADFHPNDTNELSLARARLMEVELD